MAHDDGASQDRVAAVRAFNRFYTPVMGLLRDGLLHSPYSLTEARVIYELAQREQTEVAALRGTLDVDPGHLSRLLARLERAGLVQRERSPADGRRQLARLTGEGRDAYAVLDGRSAREVGELLDGLREEDRVRLLGAMAAITEVLGGQDRSDGFVLRAPRPGDYGWVAHRHGVLYSGEYGWDETFEALVARVVADFVDRRDPRREAAWIAEVDGERAGCVFCVKRDERTAQLRLLLVEPWARGRGIGGRLVDECLRFAGRSRYERIRLWTNDVLVEARRIYERAGFTLDLEQRHHNFGHDLVGQDWSRQL
jgi:DNA-binding MarR family transcriptional regulator/RimJ/RimL family protein N-acetyltransferase